MDFQFGLSISVDEVLQYSLIAKCDGFLVNDMLICIILHFDLNVALK